MTEAEHSSALIRAFIAPERRERYLSLLATPAGRRKLRARLAHLRDLDEQFASRLTSAEQSPAGLATMLTGKRATADCV